jgi:four helix bundle protein
LNLFRIGKPGRSFTRVTACFHIRISRPFEIVFSNFALRISLLSLMSQQEDPNKRFDLEERTFQFARRTRAFVKTLAKTIGNTEDARQVIRSSGSVGANYIEANEALSKKDFVVRIKICRKEAKESRYWLRLLEVLDASTAGERESLVQEAQELMNIFGSIVRKAEP